MAWMSSSFKKFFPIVGSIGEPGIGIGVLVSKIAEVEMPVLTQMLMTKTLSVIVFREEPPFTLMVFNVGDVTCRHRFPFACAFSAIGFLDEPVPLDCLPDW